MVKLNKTDKRILDLLNRDGPLTLYEIAEKLEMKPKTVFRSLRKLFENEMISSDPKTRRYSIEREEE
ncbi:winged helix-turn-helix transcriptional regulator [Candidatus Bathyarchaeota archaeon]|nr:winged helix-turn-helix transcriptional regulator [Candidatus Bathyarchaeota archaeon]